MSVCVLVCTRNELREKESRDDEKRRTKEEKKKRYQTEVHTDLFSDVGGVSIDKA